MKLFLAGCTTHKETHSQRSYLRTQTPTGGTYCVCFWAQQLSSALNSLREKRKKNYQKKLKISLENKRLKIMTAFQYTRQESQWRKELSVHHGYARWNKPQKTKSMSKNTLMRHPKKLTFFFFLLTKELLITAAKCAERFWNLCHQHEEDKHL